MPRAGADADRDSRAPEYGASSYGGSRVANDLDLTDDIINTDDITARIEEIEDSTDDAHDPAWREANPDDAAELDKLYAILSDLSYGGDVQWRGDWYGSGLIRDSYFEDHARELADDIGAVKADETWPNNFIDWEAAAEALKQDYTEVEIDGTTYYYR